MAVRIIDASSFDNEVRKGNGIKVVDFYADWCGPCKMLAPVLDELSTEFEKEARFMKLNTDEARSISQEFGISGIPCLIVFLDGTEIGRIKGFFPKDRLKDKLSGLFADALSKSSSPAHPHEPSNPHHIAHSSAKEDDKSSDKPSISEDEKIAKMIVGFEKYASIKGFRLNPDHDTVVTIAKGLLKNESKHGFRYCPCRMVTGDKAEDRKIICPCIYHADEIKHDGWCHCMLYFAKEE